MNKAIKKILKSVKNVTFKEAKLVITSTKTTKDQSKVSLPYVFHGEREYISNRIETLNVQK